MLNEVIKSSGLICGLVYHSAAVLYDATYGNQLLVKELKAAPELQLVWVAMPDFCISENDAGNFVQQLKENK